MKELLLNASSMKAISSKSQPELREANIIVGFATHGRAVPLASSPTSRCSSPACLDIDASRKAARFVRFCDAFEHSAS